MTNPLEQYFRSPKLYVKLPSKGQYYPPDMINLAVNQEIAVYPMSALDQILMRTPDALLNGDALLKIVKNCVPDIQNVKQLVEPDINTLLLAIRIASVGPSMELELNCPACQQENNYQIDLSAIIETQSEMETNNTVELDGQLLVHLRPYNFEQRNLTLLNEVQQAQAIALLESNQDMDETQKLQELGNHVSKMAARTFEIVAKSITHITILATSTVVAEQEHIQEFLSKISKIQADAIITKLKEMNNVGIDNTCHFVCEHCQHTWDHQLDFDPSSFFA